jgi:hypothetical protein
MATFSKFVRPENARSGQITDRDLDILDAVLRYRFISAAQLVRLVGGNEDVTHRRLRRLRESALVNRFAFPGVRAHSEFYYYLDSRESLHFVAEHRGIEVHAQMLDEIRSNREKDYARAAVSGQFMQLGSLQHSLTVSRLHFMLEMSCKTSPNVQLVAWSQGAQLVRRKVELAKVVSSRKRDSYEWTETGESERLPVEPDAMFTLQFNDRPSGLQITHFFYEADRGTMVSTDILKKLRAYYHFIKKQQKHRDTFGIHPVRADSGAGAISDVGGNFTGKFGVPDDFDLFFETPVSGYFIVFWFPGTPASFTGGSIEPYPGSCAPGDCSFSSEHASPDASVKRTIESGTAQAVPEPGSALLLAVGLSVLAGIGRKRLGRSTHLSPTPRFLWTRSFLGSSPAEPSTWALGSGSVSGN